MTVFPVGKVKKRFKSKKRSLTFFRIQYYNWDNKREICVSLKSDEPFPKELNESLFSFPGKRSNLLNGLGNLIENLRR